MKKKSFYYTILFAPLLFYLINLALYFLKSQKETVFIPLFGALTVLINGFFFVYVYKKDIQLGYFFQATAFFVQLLVLIYETHL